MTEIVKALPGIFLTILCWGAYGSLLHRGQHLLNENRLKPLICVGIAYLVIAVILPCVLLAMQGKLSGDWSFGGISWSLAAGAAGTFGALGIILALTAGGKPTYVMPMVFGCAPIVNVVVSNWFMGISWKNVSPIFIAGLVLVSMGAVMVLVFKPTPPKKTEHAKPAQAAAKKEPVTKNDVATETKNNSEDQAKNPE
jgi:hypothetical protein